MSRHGRDSKRGWAAVLTVALGLALAAGAAAFPVSAACATSEEVIGRLRVLVDGEEAGPDMSDLVALKAGDPFSLKALRQAVHRAYQSGLFADVKVLREGEAVVDVTFLLEKRLVVRSVEFQSGEPLPDEKLRQSLSALRPGSLYTDDRLQRAAEEIVQGLGKEGYFHSQVRGQARKEVQTSSVDIVFAVTPGTRYLIEGVVLVGDVRLGRGDVLQRMASRKGRVYIPDAAQKDVTAIEDLYRSQGYHRVLVTLEEARIQEDRRLVTLVFRIDAGEKVEIVVKGANVPKTLLQPIWQEQVFEEWGQQEGEARILSFLRQKGFIFCIVHSSVERDGNVVRAIYDVDPGAKYRIARVTFEGLTYFAPGQLRDLLGLREGVGPFSGLDGARVFELPREIENLYRSRGFSSPRVDLRLPRDGRTVTVQFVLTEGQQQRVKDVTFVGPKLFSSGTLLAQMITQPGGPFVPATLQSDLERLETFYLNQGIRATKIEASVDQAEKDLFGLTLSIQEGQRMTIGKVIITGNNATRRNTILRELRVREGNTAYWDGILESKRRLENLGIFSEVKVEEVPLTAETLSLVINVREGERSYAGLGLGLETQEEPTYEVWNNVLRPRISAEYARYNMFGNASQLSLVAQYSLQVKRGVLSFEQPYFFGLDMKNTLMALLEREERTSYTFDRRGVSFTGLKPLWAGVDLVGTLQWANTTLVSLDIPESEVDRQFFPYSKTSISGNLIRDRRDDAFNPTRGSFLSVFAEWAFPLFGVESDFQKFFVKHQVYWPLASRVNLSSTVRVGIGRGRMPIHERFFAGGSNSFRGRTFDELGPTDPRSQEPVGGKLLLLGNIELAFPFIPALQELSWAVFYDVGNVFATRDDWRLSGLEHALGFGLRYRTPLGPLRFELGLNLLAPQGQKKVTPFITIGQIF